MKTRTTAGIAILILLSTFLLSIAPAAAENGAFSPETSSQLIFSSQGHALPADIIDARIGMYEQMIETASASADETVRSLLESYEKIKAALEGEISETYYREITHQLFDAMLLLENEFVVPGQASSPEAGVLELERNWIRAFNTLDFELMASLYRHAPETTSFSPNASTLYRGWETIAEGLKSYFNAPQGTYTWRLADEQVAMLSDDTAIILGSHVVVDRPADGQEMTGSHVFTRVVQKMDGKWHIVHEHESHLPRKKTP